MAIRFLKFYWAAAALILSSGILASKGAAESAGSFTIILGDSAPLAKGCFENALNEVASYEALESCNLSIESEKLTIRKRATVHVNRGVIWFNLGEYESAISDFSVALDLNINIKARVYTNRGLSYEAISADQLAKADYEAALDFRPDYGPAERRLRELEKPLYQRQSVPRKIRVEAPAAPVLTI